MFGIQGPLQPRKAAAQNQYLQMLQQRHAAQMLAAGTGVQRGMAAAPTASQPPIPTRLSPGRKRVLRKNYDKALKSRTAMNPIWDRLQALATQNNYQSIEQMLF